MNKKIPQHEHNRRYLEYKKGLSDVDIGNNLYLSPVTIHKWRKTNGLPPNKSQGRPRKEEWIWCQTLEAEWAKKRIYRLAGV